MSVAVILVLIIDMYIYIYIYGYICMYTPQILRDLKYQKPGTYCSITLQDYAGFTSSTVVPAVCVRKVPARSEQTPGIALRAQVLQGRLNTDRHCGPIFLYYVSLYTMLSSIYIYGVYGCFCHMLQIHLNDAVVVIQASRYYRHWNSIRLLIYNLCGSNL